MKKYLITWLILMICLGAFASEKSTGDSNSTLDKHSFKSSLNDAQLAADALFGAGLQRGAQDQSYL
ncbi:MAG: hypothetical protein LRZ88_04050 [Candidatus Cloacimonetes bacterium]|nr:hypothetical protein [Candidatus Cloacimonadota bacterium]